MARTVTLQQLRDRVLAQTDMSGSAFIVTSELDEWINNAGSQLHELLLAKHADHFSSSSLHTIASGQSTITLPDDAVCIRALDRIDGTDRSPVNPHGMSGRDVAEGKCDFTFRLLGSTVYVAPSTSAPGSYELFTLPAWSDLSGSSSSITGEYTKDRREQFIVLNACQSVLTKQEGGDSDTALALASQLSTLVQTLQPVAAERQATGRKAVVDVYGETRWDQAPWPLPGSRRWSG